MLEVEKNKDVVIIKVSGRLEINQALELEDLINNHISNGAKYFAFDLGNVHYLSSSGIRVFIATLRQLKELKGKMVLANLSNNVIKTLKIVELDSLFEIVDNLEDAVKVIESEK